MKFDYCAGQRNPADRLLEPHVLAAETLSRLGVDEHGLEEMDRRILRCLRDQAGPVALKTIASALTNLSSAPLHTSTRASTFPFSARTFPPRLP